MSIPPLYVVRLAECAGYYKYWSDRTEERCFGAELMSALGQKQTSETHALHVRFTPQSGHKSTYAGMSAFSQKRTFDRLTKYGTKGLLET
jgi:hypothetical protein